MACGARKEHDCYEVGRSSTLTDGPAIRPKPTKTHWLDKTEAVYTNRLTRPSSKFPIALFAVNNSARPPSSICGQRCVISFLSCLSFVTGSGTPPLEGILESGPR